MWDYDIFTVPSSGNISLSTLKLYIQRRINNGLATGSVPNNLRGCASWYGVSTSGTVSFSSFRGKSITWAREWIDLGGGGGFEP